MGRRGPQKVKAVSGSGPAKRGRKNVNAASGSGPAKRGRRGRGNSVGASSSRAPPPPPSISDQWFDAVLASDEESRKKMLDYRNRNVQPCKYVDWSPMKQVDQYDDFSKLLSYDVEIGGVSYTMHDWETLVEIREKVYPVLTKEFLASLKFDFSEFGSNTYMVFRLGGEQRNLTGYEFCRIMGLYQGRDNAFIDELLRDADMMPYSFSSDDAADLFKSFCPNLAYQASTTTASALPVVFHRCLQRILANTINFRKESNEKLNNKDVWLMSRILAKTRVNIPALLLRQFTDEKYRKSMSPLYGGHYVTLIARHFDIDVESLVSFRMTSFARRSFVKGNILRVYRRELKTMPPGPVVGAAAATAGADSSSSDSDSEDAADQSTIDLILAQLQGFETRFDSMIDGLETRFTEFQTGVYGRFDTLDGQIAELRRQYQHDQPPPQD